MNKIYMLQKHVGASNSVKEAEYIYTVEPKEAAELISSGHAVKADNATLDGFERQIDTAVGHYREQAKRIDENAILSPLEKQYKTLGARNSLDEAVAAVKVKYDTELQALSIVSAGNAFKTSTSTPESREFVDGVLLMLKTTDAKTVSSLIEAQLPAMSPEIKTELLRRYDDIEKHAPGAFTKLLPKLKTGDSALQYQILQRVKDTGKPDTSYHNLKLTHRTYQEGYLSREVSEQFTSDRTYSAAMAALKGGE